MVGLKFSVNVSFNVHTLTQIGVFAQYHLACAAMLFRHNAGDMELRHLRYYVAVADALNFTKAAARLRVAQPALSRQVRDLEEEIGVDLLLRSPRGVTLTAEGKLFLEEARDLLKRTVEAVEKTRSLARGDYGELPVGYSPSPTVDILPPALGAFQKSVPRVTVRFHDLAGNELADGLRNGVLELAIMQRPTGSNGTGLTFEPLHAYPICVAVAPGHPLAKLKVVPLARLAGEKLVVFRRQEYTDYHALLERVLQAVHPRPVIAVECDGSSSLITEVATGRGGGDSLGGFWQNHRSAPQTPAAHAGAGAAGGGYRAGAEWRHDAGGRKVL